jgi:hypothetical protein
MPSQAWRQANHERELQYWRKRRQAIKQMHDKYQQVLLQNRARNAAYYQRKKQQALLIAAQQEQERP